MKMINLAARKAGRLTVPFDKTTGEPMLLELVTMSPDGEPYTPTPGESGFAYILAVKDAEIGAEVIEKFVNHQIGMLPEVIATKIREQIAEHGSIADAMRDLGVIDPTKDETVSVLEEPVLLSMS